MTCVTGKGLLNRAHAYKAAVDKNTAAGSDPDADVTAGLFMYPVLMAADILMFNAHKVPVGRDQIQHIEMARDMAQSFNHLYGEHFVLPEAAIEESVATLPGLDGRKMSKSYDNTIPLFAPREQLRKLIAGIVTDSRAPGEPKDVEGSALFQIYQAFASAEETDALRQAYADGIGWGDAKQAAVRAHRPRNRADARALRGPDGRPGRHGDDPPCWRGQGARTGHAVHGGIARGGRAARPGYTRRPAQVPAPYPPHPRLQAWARCPRSSNTAKKTASSISSWLTPRGNCCCKAPDLPHRVTLARPSPGFKARLRRRCPTLRGRLCRRHRCRLRPLTTR